MSLFFCALPVFFCAFSAQADMPVPVILDTDIGDDIDDTWALGMLLGSPQVDLKLIVTAADDTEKKTRLVAKLLESMGRPDIPLATGKKTSSNKLNQEKWLGDYKLESFKGKTTPDGVQTLVDTINSAKEQVVLLVIGPMTNIQEALKRDPNIAEKARIVAMAGSVKIGYNGKSTPDREYNVFKDVEAARAVFAAPWDITIAPLDTCGTLILKGENFAKVASSKDPKAVTVIENYREWVNFAKYPNGESSVLYDTEAVYLTFDDSIFEMQTVKLSIDDKGVTVPDEKGRPVHCAMNWKDRAAFENALIKALTSTGK
jgi:inosine-uridine nucleoside N-ribohydrolase